MQCGQRGKGFKNFTGLFKEMMDLYINSKFLFVTMCCISSSPICRLQTKIQINDPRCSHATLICLNQVPFQYNVLFPAKLILFTATGFKLGWSQKNEQPIFASLPLSSLFLLAGSGCISGDVAINRGITFASPVKTDPFCVLCSALFCHFVITIRIFFV